MDVDEDAVWQRFQERISDVTRFRFLGTWCSVCHEKQYRSPSGAVCINGHGGAPPETNELFLLAHALEH